MRAPRWILFGLALATAGPASAQDLGDLSGIVDVSHVDAEVDGRNQETVRQVYTVNYFKQLTSYVDFRAGFRYYDFDLDTEAAGATDAFQEEIQPTAELSWAHPLFRFTVNGSRRISRSPAISGDLINQSLLLDWQSAWADTPVFGLRYELRDLEETGSGAFRDVNDQRLTATVEYDRQNEQFYYDLSRNWTDNVVRGVETVEYAQRLQYLGAHVFGARRQLQLSSQYRYTRSDRNSEVATGERLLRRLGADRGLGGVDTSPDQGALPVVPGLVDGNTVAPVAPPLGIGAGDFDRNIGVDLGVRRDRISAIHVYVDRLSAATVQWSVWVSDDNLLWDDTVVAGTRSRFVPTLSRYEIEFLEVPARYIKVVNEGVNPVAGVQVTEIEVFEGIPETDDVEYDTSSHLADARLVWRIDPRWEASADVVGRYEPPTETFEERLSYDYGLRLRFAQTDAVVHIARLGQSWQKLSGAGRDSRDDAAGYTLTYDPLPTLGGAISTGVRRTEENGEVALRSANALVAATATPWRPLRANFEAGVSRVDRPVVDYDSDSWHTRLSLDGEVTRQFHALVTWLHRQSTVGASDRLRVQRRLVLSGEFQLTSALFARAAVNLSDDETFRRSEEYLLSWRLFSRLLLSGQVSTDDGGSGPLYERYAVNANLDLFERLMGFRNVTLYARFSDSDQRGAGGTHILSWQQGLRANF